MIHTTGNYSFKEPPFREGDTISGGNYSQASPDTEICKDIKDLIITGGNFTNCKKQPLWTVTGGNWTQVSFCTHLHPNLIAHGLQCEEDCIHRSNETVTIKIDADEVRRRKDKNKPLTEYVATKVKDKDDVDIIKHTVKEYVYKDGRIK